MIKIIEAVLNQLSLILLIKTLPCAVIAIGLTAVCEFLPIRDQPYLFRRL